MRLAHRRLRQTFPAEYNRSNNAPTGKSESGSDCGLHVQEIVGDGALFSPLFSSVIPAIDIAPHCGVGCLVCGHIVKVRSSGSAPSQLASIQLLAQLRLSGVPIFALAAIADHRFASNVKSRFIRHLLARERY